MISVLSCKQKPGNQKNDKKFINKEIATIKIVAQAEPFGKEQGMDMQVKGALEKLEFANVKELEIDDLDLVVGIPLEQEQIAIPLVYMSAFEVANFSTNGEQYSVTWCSIAGSVRVFEGIESGLDFGYALHKNNLLVVDRQTQSVWSQLSGEAIHGAEQGNKLQSVPIIQSTWGFWKSKYPDTKLLVNKDTTGAVFPQFINENPHYYYWEPGQGRPVFTDVHQTQVLGLGVELDSMSAYFPFEVLFENNSPVVYELGEEKMLIHFDREGLTAWVEDEQGEMIPGTITYSWAWKGFYPNTKMYSQH